MRYGFCSLCKSVLWTLVPTFYVICSPCGNFEYCARIIIFLNLSLNSKNGVKLSYSDINWWSITTGIFKIQKFHHRISTPQTYFDVYYILHFTVLYNNIKSISFNFSKSFYKNLIKKNYLTWFWSTATEYTTNNIGNNCDKNTEKKTFFSF